MLRKFLLFSLFVMGVHTVTAAPLYTMRYSTANPKGSSAVVYAERFKLLAEKYSQGKIEVELHIDAELGTEQDNVMMTADGEVHMGTCAANNIAPFAPVMGILALPYMFPTEKSANHFVRQPIVDKLNKEVIASTNIRILSWMRMGYRTFTNAEKVVTKPSDLKGLRIRVPENDIMVATYRAWGVEPIPVAWAKTYNALATGLVNAKDNPLLNSIAMPNMTGTFYDVQKYITNIHFLLLFHPHFINEEYYQSLPDDIKEIVKKSAWEASEYATKWVDDRTQKTLDDLISKGMKYTEPADNEEEWIKLAKEKVWPQFYDKVGGKALVDEVVKVIESAK